ncbi:hypothetical protein D3C81_1902070 [compost metagenome]
MAESQASAPEPMFCRPPTSAPAVPARNGNGSIAPLVASGKSIPAPKKNRAAGISSVQTVITPSKPGTHIITPASRQLITDCHISVEKRLFGRPANHAPKNAAGIGRMNRMLTTMLLNPRPAPSNTPEQASNTAIPARPPISISR